MEKYLNSKISVSSLRLQERTSRFILPRLDQRTSALPGNWQMGGFRFWFQKSIFGTPKGSLCPEPELREGMQAKLWCVPIFPPAFRGTLIYRKGWFRST